MAVNNFSTYGKTVIGDGAGHIYLIDQATGIQTLYMWAGLDPSFAWGGAAVIFADITRKTAWCANLDGSGIYNLGVSAATGCYLFKPLLADNLSIYCASFFDTNSHDYSCYVFGGGGYGLRRILQHSATIVDLSPEGSVVMSSGHNGNGIYRISEVNVSNPSILYLPYTPPGVLFPHAVMGSMSPNYEHDGGKYTCMITNNTGLDTSNPATYKPSDIVVARRSTGSVTRLNVSPATPGHLVLHSRLTPGQLGVLYDFVAPAGCGVWAVQNPVQTTLVGGAGVYGNPNGGIYQFRSALGHCVKGCA